MGALPAADHFESRGGFRVSGELEKMTTCKFRENSILVVRIRKNPQNDFTVGDLAAFAGGDKPRIF